MFAYSHLATEYGCRHCGKNAGHDPEMCFYCGPICEDCLVSDDPSRCPYERKKEEKEKKKKGN